MRQRSSSNVTIPLREIAQTDRTTIGSYAVIGPIARGGTAAVVLAEHVQTRQRVALKLLHPSYAGFSEIVDRMLQEHTVAGAARHANLLEIHEAATTDAGVPYLAMEYLDGENLGDLADRGRLELDAIVALAAQIAAGISALHRAGYVHGDIKPDNVFVLYQNTLDGWPRVKVIDYGVAVRADAVPEDDAPIAGTPAYMAPEQWRGRPEKKSDLYALGCTLFELLTGEQPFQGTLPHMMYAHSEVLPERLATRRSDIPSALERLVSRLLSKDPALRPTAIEAEIELQRISRTLQTDAEDVALSAS